MSETLNIDKNTALPKDSLLEQAYSKITWRLIPFLATLWILAWIDRVNIGYAKLQMLGDLKFSEAVYGLGAGIRPLAKVMDTATTDYKDQRSGSASI